MIASRFKKSLHVALIMGLAMTMTAATAPSQQAAIAARQTGFKKMGSAMKALSDQLKADAPARGTMIAAARTIAITAREQPKLFPADSGPASGRETQGAPGDLDRSRDVRCPNGAPHR